MNKILNKWVIFLMIVALPFAGCDNGFDEMNTNPNAAVELDLDFQMTYIQLQTSGERYENWRAVLIYSSTMMQHLAALPTYWSGDKYLYNAGYSASLFDRAFAGYVRDLVDLINRGSADPENVNKIAVARIWKVAAYSRMTDMYGDLPYSEAGKGIIDGIYTPKYDTQQSIYTDMLKELEEAIASFDASKPTYGAADIVYGGDIDAWKTYGYSLMLRLGMRISNADAGMAETYVKKAIAGGVMASNADNAFMKHTDGEGINRNGIGEVFLADDNQRMSHTFVDWMDTHGDPRLAILGVVASGGPQKGLPNGYDATTIVSYVGGDDLETYTRVNPLIAQVSSPMLFQTYGEVELLLAEAALKGWHTGSTQTHYENGVRGAMQMWGETFDASLAIDDATVDAYLAANPFDGADAAEQIGTQYWAATFWNEYEAYANWRRTGYPALTPVNYPGNVTGGTIPRRLQYAESEYGVNQAAIEAANAAQGPDVFTTRVWWDK